jgi:hypothetical protein
MTAKKIKSKMTAPKPRARVVKYVALALVVGIGAWLYVRDRSLREVRAWADLLLGNIRSGNQGDHVLLRINQQPVWHFTFADGTWCLAVKPANAEGGLTDWALLVHSSREEWYSTRAFPDAKAFQDAMGNLPKESWSAFSAAAQARLGFEPLPR